MGDERQGRRRGGGEEEEEEEGRRGRARCCAAALTHTLMHMHVQLERSGREDCAVPAAILHRSLTVCLRHAFIMAPMPCVRCDGEGRADARHSTHSEHSSVLECRACMSVYICRCQHGNIEHATTSAAVNNAVIVGICRLPCGRKGRRGVGGQSSSQEELPIMGRWSVIIARRPAWCGVRCAVSIR